MVFGRNFVGNVLSRKKEAEQSAAEVAYKSLTSAHPPIFTNRQETSLTTSTTRPILSGSSASSRSITSSSIPSAPLDSPRSMKHLPSHHSDIEDFIMSLISDGGGRIRKIWDLDNRREYQFEIAGSFHLCGNIGHHHRRNHIYFKVNPEQMFYYQKCHDEQCRGYQSVERAIPQRERRNSDSFDDDDDHHHDYHRYSKRPRRF